MKLSQLKKLENEANHAKIEFVEQVMDEAPYGKTHIDVYTTGGFRDERYDFGQNRVGVVRGSIGKPAIYNAVDRLAFVGSDLDVKVYELMREDSNDIAKDSKKIKKIIQAVEQSPSDKVIINGGLDNAIHILQEISKRLQGINKTIVYGGSNASWNSNPAPVLTDIGVELAAAQLYPRGSFNVAANLGVFNINDVERNTFSAIGDSRIQRNLFSRKGSMKDHLNTLIKVLKFVVFDFGGTYGKTLDNSAGETSLGYVFSNPTSIQQLYVNVLKELGVAIDLANCYVGKQKDSMLSTDEDRMEIVKIIAEANELYNVIVHGTDSMFNTVEEVYSNNTNNNIFLSSCTPLKEIMTTDGHIQLGATAATINYLDALKRGEIIKPEKRNFEKWIAQNTNTNANANADADADAWLNTKTWVVGGGIPYAYNSNMIKDNNGKFIKTSREKSAKYRQLNKEHLDLYRAVQEYGK